MLNTKRYIFSSIDAFVFIFLYELHGILLKDLYIQTLSVWRPKGESNMWFVLFSQLAFAYIVAFIFTRHYEAKGVQEGVRFGLYIGLLLAALDFGAYSYLPVPFSLVLAWMATSVLKGLGTGAVLALVYKN